MEIFYTAAFIRLLAKLPIELQEEAFEKIELFRAEKNITQLKIHKLKGELKGRHNFSVNYKIRIVFCYTEGRPKEAILHAIGDQAIYD